MAKYVKAPGSDTWHWCTNCSNYPSQVADSQSTRPTSGELCNQCRAKEKDNNCRG